MKEKLIERIKELGYEAELQTTTKNGVIKDGVVIKESDNDRIAPIIYIDPYFDDIEDEATRIINLYGVHKNPKFNIDEFLNIENVATNIRLGFQKTSEENIVKQDTMYAGIEAYLYMNVHLDNDSNATAKMKPELLDQLHIDEEEAWNLAAANTALEARVITMAQCMAEMSGLPIDMFEDMTIAPMYILSNNQKFRGAACITDIKTMKKLSKIANTNDFFAIPSSVHEWILIPYDESMDIDDVSKMVCEVNQTEVEPEDRLVDNAFKIHIDEEVTLG